MARALFYFLILIMLNGCDSSDGTDGIETDPITPPITDGNWYRPAVSVTWQWQLQGDINTSYPVDIYDLNLFDSSETLIQTLQDSGKKVICYFSAGSYEQWRIDATQFSDIDLGNLMEDWIGERWLDIRSDNVRSIMLNRLDLAKQKNCDGVEPDNMDGYFNNSGFNFTVSEQLNYNRFIANESHSRGLSVGLKNNLNQVDLLVNYFDFAVNEMCFEFSECDLLTPFINQDKPVLNAEYKTNYINDESSRQKLCDNSINRQFSTIILPRELDNLFRFNCI